MTRVSLITITVCALSFAQTPPATVTSTYHFVTPMSPHALQEAASLVRTVAGLTKVAQDIPTATLTFTGPAEAASFAQWLLPRIDTTTLPTGPEEYKFASGDIGRVNFATNMSTPQQMQELITVLRTVADVQRISSYSANHAVASRAPEWQDSFAQWIFDGLNQPRDSPASSGIHEFTVGGPDYKGLGHGARINFLSTVKDPRPMQELLTVLRTVGDVQKVFSFTASHAFVLRAGDTDLARAEWIIAQIDAPSATVGSTFVAPSADDVTRAFRIKNATPQWIASTLTGIRTDLKIRKVFPMTSPAFIVVRGTADQIAAVGAYMTARNALLE